MIQYIKDNVYIVVNESTNRANITIGADWEDICKKVIALHQNIVNQKLDRLHIDNPEIPKSYINKIKL